MIKRLFTFLLFLLLLTGNAWATPTGQIVKVINLFTGPRENCGTPSYGQVAYPRVFKWEAGAWGGTNVHAFLEFTGETTNASDYVYCSLYTTNGVTQVSGSEVKTNSLSYVPIRSGDISGSLVDGTEYWIEVKADSSVVSYIVSARLIVILSGTLTAWQTDIDLCGYDDTGMQSSYANLNNISADYLQRSAHILWTAGNWDGTVDPRFEAYFGQTGGTPYEQDVCVWDLTANAMVAGSQLSVTDGNLHRLRSGTLSLVDGHEYEYRGINGGSGHAVVYSATLIVKQTGNPTKSETHYLLGTPYYVYATDITWLTLMQAMTWHNSEWVNVTLQVFFEGLLGTGLAAGPTDYMGVSDGTNILGQFSTTSNTLARFRTTVLTPIDGSVYVAQLKQSEGLTTDAYGISPRFVILATLPAAGGGNTLWPLQP